MKWPWQTKHAQKSVRSVLVDSLNDPFLFSALNGDSVTPTKAFEFYRKNSSVATAVDIVADTFEQIKPILALPDGSILENHPILDLLNNPNPYMEWSGFAGRISRHFLLTEQTHFYCLGVNTLPPSELYPVKPILVSANTMSQSEYVARFTVSSGVAKGEYDEATGKQGIARYYDKGLKELYRIAGFSSTTTEAMPDSPLQAASLETLQQIKGRVHNMSMIENGGRLSMLIVFNEDSHLDDDAFDDGESLFLGEIDGARAQVERHRDHGLGGVVNMGDGALGHLGLADQVLGEVVGKALDLFGDRAPEKSGSI